jgi:hypothetical protein
VIRTQISLTPDQMSRLRREAVRRRVSVAELVRQAVDRELVSDDDARRRRELIEAIGGGHSGLRDVAERHDDYFADAIAEDHGIGG